MSRKGKKTRQRRQKRQGVSGNNRMVTSQHNLLIPVGDESFWIPFEEYNRLDSKKRADALDHLGIRVDDSDVLGQLTKGHFVIPGKTRYQCQQCGECCRYARKIAIFTYDSCPFLGEDNLCTKHDRHYQVCKWFPFWIYQDERYGNLLTVKPYCSGYGHGEPVDYEATLKDLLGLRNSSIKDPDGAEVIHEVIYLPTRKEWAFPSSENVDELMNFINKDKSGKAQEKKMPSNQLDHARRYTSGLLSKADDANITVDENGIITDVNDSALSLSGCQYEELVGREFDELFTDPERASVILRKCFAKGKVTGSSQRLSFNNKIIPVLCDAMTYRDLTDGMMHGVLVSIRPVSEGVYQEIEQARNYARGLIESSLDPMVTLDRDGIITDVNEATIRVTGCSRDELVGSRFREYFTDPEMADAGIRRVFENERVRDYELDLESPSGDVVPVSFNATIYRGTDGEVLGAFAIARDMSNIRQAHRRLEELYNYARGLIESSLDPMVTLDRDGIITDVNEATIRVTGCSRDELVGSRFREYFTDPEMADAGIRRVFENERVRDYELDLKSPSGDVVPVSFNATEYRNAEEVVGVFAVAREKRHKCGSLS